MKIKYSTNAGPQITATMQKKNEIKIRAPLSAIKNLKLKCEGVLLLAGSRWLNSIKKLIVAPKKTSRKEAITLANETSPNTPVNISLVNMNNNKIITANRKLSL